ncbi:alpha-(1,3)-fucosyltransferase C-like isoform X1 [Leptidea sinapis]|uniref:alpha-(1,3)-fucosyltransferase C-like isoform X1 n=1 Tax=Leptidea sinapis TaxID=189913 RepID=UPI0021C4AD82|nr:alpha-(1,3)-fucosyltransferase C-like isoform X1 [Leptidea sinapis]
MRAQYIIKPIICCSLVICLMYIYMTVKYSSFTNTNKFSETLQMEGEVNGFINVRNVSEKRTNLKYILQWTSPTNVPFVYMGVGQQGFIDRNCSHTNCYVTSDRNYLGDYTKFDVIAFAGPEVVRFYDTKELPLKRSPHQKFAFASIESADNYPVCSRILDNFFNWTWTYRLDSEAKWGYIVIRDSENKIVGPKTNMHWMKLEDMDPVSDNIREIIKSKTKAAAWFVSNCYTKSKREVFVKSLQAELINYDLKIDIYGKCGPLKCPHESDECNKKLETDYYFYLSFENSFAEDYVTEKLLHSLQNNAVPIVFGAANYTRFMPDGIYLNARELGVKKLAEKMNELIENQEMYIEYFKWKNHYSYYRRFESIETDDYCRFCSILYDDELVKKKSTYENFKDWWNPPNRC